MKRQSSFDIFMLVFWGLLLVLTSGRGGVFSGGEGSGLPDSHPQLPGGGSFMHPHSPEDREPLHPRFTPIAGPVVVTPIGAPPLGPISLPSAPNLPGAFGQGSAIFAPPPPASVGVAPPAVLLIPQGGLGISSTNAFVPGPPQLPVLSVAGNAPQASLGEGIPFFVPFALGPTAILNQFVQPPLLPFGQVGVPPQNYLPGFFTGTPNPFNRSCNYYYFAGCGGSGGAAADFNYSSR
ncbi:MAG: hypothetical protein ACYDBP_09050 [Leptospirales bacterium]